MTDPTSTMPREESPPTISDLVPEGIRRARAAFLRDFPALMADRKTCGKYVCYHLESMVAVASTYDKIVREAIARNLPEDATLYFKVTEGSAAWERHVAVEGDINDF